MRLMLFAMGVCLLISPLAFEAQATGPVQSSTQSGNASLCANSPTPSDICTERHLTLYVTKNANGSLELERPAEECIHLCRSSNDTVRWKGKPASLKFNVDFNGSDSPFLSHHFDETKNESDAIRDIGESQKEFDYVLTPRSKVKATRKKRASDPGIIIHNQ